MKYLGSAIVLLALVPFVALAFLSEPTQILECSPACQEFTPYYQNVLYIVAVVGITGVLIYSWFQGED